MAPSKDRAQETVSGPLTPAHLCVLPHQPLRFSIYSQFISAANDTAYLLSFISGPCLILQRRVEQCDTDGETKAGGEEVNLPKSASCG